MTLDPTDTLKAVERLKAEIDKLTAQQSDALKLARFVGMTPDEATEYDQRRDLVLRLVRDLAMLEESQ